MNLLKILQGTPEEAAALSIAIQNSSTVQIQTIKNVQESVLANITTQYAKAISFSNGAAITVIIFLSIFTLLFPTLDILHYIRFRNQRKEREKRQKQKEMSANKFKAENTNKKSYILKRTKVKSYNHWRY